MGTEPLAPGTTFWRLRDGVSWLIEVGEPFGGLVSGQRYRERMHGTTEWVAYREFTEELRRWHDEKAEPPEPIVYTLATLVRGVMAGRVCTEGLTVSIDNDSMYAQRETGGKDEWGDPEFVEVWHGNGPRCELEGLLNALGLPAEGV